jgi:hypothetical protein
VEDVKLVLKYIYIYIYIYKEEEEEDDGFQLGNHIEEEDFYPGEL